MKKNKNKIDKKLQLLKTVMIVLGVIFILELGYFGYKLYKTRKESTYYSAMNSAISLNDKYIGVGLSDSKHSKFLKYQAPGYNKPFIWVYDNTFKIENEIKLNLGYNGAYLDIAKVDDGYIAVGYLEMSEKQHEGAISEGIISKYDKDFKLVWRKNLSILDNTKFNVVKVMEDGTIWVCGTSIYESDVIGNHTTGGAILVKYSSEGEKLFVINNGGPKTGEFKDIEVLNDGIIAVGLKSSGTGIIYKYDMNGNEIWHNYYGYTDSDGLTSITKITDDEFVITGTKLDDKGKTDNYKAAILKYNGKGELLKETIYKKENINKFVDSIVYKDKILVSGLYGKKEDNVLKNSSTIVTYNKELEKENEQLYTYNKTFTINKLINLNNSYLVIGHTNSKINELKTNGLDFYQVIKKNTIK